MNVCLCWNFNWDWITLLVILATCNKMITVVLLGPAAVSVHAVQGTAAVSSRKKPRRVSCCKEHLFGNLNEQLCAIKTTSEATLGHC